MITGPMFSGKTTMLIKEIERSRARENSAVLLKSAMDTRYSVNDVVTHDGVRLPAMVLPEGEPCVPTLKRIAEDYDVIGVDEGHFWDGTPGLAAALDELAFSSKTVYVAMLNRKNIGTPFDLSKELIPLADEVFFLAARCARCGGKATFTQRITNYRIEGKQKFVGGAGDYEARCRSCFVKPKSEQVPLFTDLEPQAERPKRLRRRLKIKPLLLPGLG